MKSKMEKIKYLAKKLNENKSIGIAIIDGGSVHIDGKYFFSVSSFKAAYPNTENIVFIIDDIDDTDGLNENFFIGVKDE